MGKVYLIGAGPGDEELFTLKAIRVLKKCTAVLYDRLASESILKYLKEDCCIYYCGKEPGSHYKTQEEINEMLVTLAKQGHIVGRIKGGDPYVFGRGGEEALRLLEEGIEFETLPGITSPISVLNYAGIPITQRGMSQSFHIFTGMSSTKIDIDWEAAARLKGTLVFMMGLENLESIASSLMKNGLSKNTPSAVIMRGTTAKQKTVVSTVENITAEVKAAGLKSPCIIVMGKVVELGKSLNWYEKKPLFGLNVCVTRTKEQAAELGEKLLDLGAQVTEINSISVKNTAENLEAYIDKLPDYNYIIMTSVNAVNTFFDYLREASFDIRRLKGKFAVVGSATEKALRERGIMADIICDEFLPEDLVRKLSDEVKVTDTILIPRSKNSRAYLVEALSERGCSVDEVHSYEVVKGSIKNAGAFENCNAVTFTSPSTVRNMIDIFGTEALKEKLCIAIGPITEKELIKNHIDCIVAEEYTTDGIIKKLMEVKADV
jgi:uroporphyrinogen III methyltransferase/synthase